jgi:hypothetical protein
VDLGSHEGGASCRPVAVGTQSYAVAMFRDDYLEGSYSALEAAWTC